MKKMNLARSSDIRSMYINQFYFYMPAELCKMGFNKMNPFPKVSEYKMYQKKKKSLVLWKRVNVMTVAVDT